MKNMPEVALFFSQFYVGIPLAAHRGRGAGGVNKEGCENVSFYKNQAPSSSWTLAYVWPISAFSQ